MQYLGCYNACMAYDHPLVLIAHNVRSAHNVGSLFRTADAFGLRQVILSGYTPYPRTPDDSRLPHIVEKLTRQIAKTALGAEQTLSCLHFETLPEAVTALRGSGFHIYALEQSLSATPIQDIGFQYPSAILVGNEVAGLNDDELALADDVIEIRMHGQKESLNVSVAAGIALYLARLGIV
jgi:23S rRNA (guanosine2251-2'-O)-methyltransferase